ncbi:hybrid sensor histidine kinase/response regulator [Geopsychrobacter electrodiphilus]|uniref:hybrid sensor histidine kinase/response regulator n=1 Tax=Geopsychrobacter electrodiphilus TaxID=225196 RepID=UPI001B7FE7F7|nr:PAS domain-containing sensor histidine kinase [Geopsychrobacter electrodiphilus]
MEKHLRQSLEFAENIINTVREPLIALDQDLRVVNVNRSFYDFFKVKPEETVGELIYDLGNKQWDIPRLRELLENILPQHTSFDGYEVEHDFATIGKRIMLLNARQIEQVMGKERIILLAIEDITERKAIEAGLEKTRKELEVVKKIADAAHEFADSVINTVREPLISLDQDLRVVTVNRSFYEFFRVKPEETVGQLIYDLGNKQWDIPKLRELLENILPEKSAFDDYEVAHDFATIGRRIMLLNARQIEQAWGKERVILLAIEDITERSRLEDQLEESELRYRRLFETASDGIVLLEKKEGHVAHANPALEKMLGYSEAECLGKKLRDLGVSIDSRHFSATMQDLDREGILNYEDVPLKTKSGEQIYTDIYMVDRAKLAQCNIRDVSERKKLQAQLLHSQKMEAVGTLAGGIAHDFNNILNVIMGYGDMVLATLAADSPAREHMSEVLVAADRAANLTKRLLVFSRKSVAEKTAVNINGLILNLQKMLVRIIPANIDFHLDFTDTPLIASADTGQIEQVLINLVSNAKDVMPEGGRLILTTGLEEMNEEYVAACGYGRPGRYALITVADTGQGMDVETQQKIFEPFFTTKRVGEGTGLGLAICYGIIKQHNGYIKVYSEPGEGTTFKIYLPLCNEAVLDQKPEGNVSVKGGHETVLLAEDDEALRDLARMVLESFDYRVITAVDGEEALAKFLENKQQISLVLLDMIMPKKNGKEVFEAIRKVSPKMKILFSSGYGVDIVTNKELEGDGLDFIQKPYPPKSLLLKVRELLDK